ncbi:MAG: phage shock protein PspC [Ignavibacteria bacterium]|nr:phage shock protein PspC [Ignavibacteria bacterium]
MHKQLKRTRKNKVIAGVAGGIAEYFDIDPVIVRAIFVITLLGWGFSLLAYIVLWIIVPEKDLEETHVENEEPEQSKDTIRTEKKRNMRLLGGVLLIICGLVLLAEKLLPWFCLDYFWPLVLIAFGIYILFKSFGNKSVREA